ncbi:hypothetical protein [Acinetobacter chengduensis]|uniref:WYL domain-containing protein n=1 Tax=Acinetobacter chengduensis TaxID=2420890 RepID=A0ABX9TU01_9GAMM|nr:hypothetical protein [Acinetobacter chengduensis]RLL19000.1 hypothetical protein D9K81_14685 [Acinetobacter chengduensis]
MLNEYQIALRQLIERAQRRGKAHDLRFYQVQDDEVHDPSLISYRLYKSRMYVTEVKVACGISYAHELIPVRAYYFPTLRDILALRQKHGVDS